MTAACSGRAAWRRADWVPRRGAVVIDRHSRPYSCGAEVGAPPPPLWWSVGRRRCARTRAAARGVCGAPGVTAPERARSLLGLRWWGALPAVYPTWPSTSPHDMPSPGAAWRSGDARWALLGGGGARPLILAALHRAAQAEASSVGRAGCQGAAVPPLPARGGGTLLTAAVHLSLSPLLALAPPIPHTPSPTPLSHHACRMFP